jgi:ferritin-like metal-binding protein YciE
MQKTSDEQGLKALHEDFMKDVYWAEKKLTKSLPKMVSATSSPDLINALEENLSVPKEQITRLEEVFEAFGKTPSGIKCEASGTAFFLCPHPMQYFLHITVCF